jgi:hypothetical protein
MCDMPLTSHSSYSYASHPTLQLQHQDPIRESACPTTSSSGRPIPTKRWNIPTRRPHAYMRARGQDPGALLHTTGAHEHATHGRRDPPSVIWRASTWTCRGQSFTKIAQAVRAPPQIRPFARLKDALVTRRSSAPSARAWRPTHSQPPRRAYLRDRSNIYTLCTRAA